MRQAASRALERLKWHSRRAGAAVQQLVVQAMLVFIYWIGLSLTRAAAALFARRYLGLFASRQKEPSLWRDVEGYEQDLEGLHGQN